MVNSILFFLRICLFFFQAEDGIRDRTVTGVQTCALPIYPPRGNQSDRRGRRRRRGRDRRAGPQLTGPPLGLGRGRRAAAGEGPPRALPRVAGRSEERRVGKEWRCGWSAAYLWKASVGRSG